MKTNSTTHGLKFLIGGVIVFLFRLIPFRLPNVEPLLATVMPFSKRLSAPETFFFGFFSIVLFDSVTSGWGIWTLITALAYGALGFASHFYFASRAASVGNFVRFGIVGTLAYDAITGLTVGPLLYHQPFIVALIGQIPFTLLHLAGTVVFATFLSPALYRWIVENKRFEFPLLKTRVIA